MNLRHLDQFESFKMVQKDVDDAVKKGELSREEAHSIITEARKNYKEQKYNKFVDKQIRMGR